MRSGRRSDALRRREVKPYHRPSCGRAKGIADGEAATLETAMAGEPTPAGARSGVARPRGRGGRLARQRPAAAGGVPPRGRGLAGIATHGWSYGQSAIVATVAHER